MVLRTQTVPLDEPEVLAYLVWLGVTANVFEVEYGSISGCMWT